MNPVTVTLRHFQLFQLLNIHYQGTRRVIVKNYLGSLLPGYPTGTRGSPTSMNLNVNVNLELRQSHAQLHMHHRLARYIIIATIYKPSHRVKKLMGHGSTPSDPWPMWPIRFSWPIWPMTHRPIPCSDCRNATLLRVGIRLRTIFYL